MLQYFIIFTIIGFVVGKIFPKGSMVYGFLLIIPIVWAFKFGIFWAIVTYAELLFGVTIAYISRSNKVSVSNIHQNILDTDEDSTHLANEYDSNNDVISSEDIKPIIFILANIAYCQDDVSGDEIQPIIINVLKKLVDDLEISGSQKEKAFMDVYMIFPRPDEKQTTPIIDYARELRFNNHHFKKEIVMGFISMFVLKYLPITTKREKLFKEVMSYVYPNKDMKIAVAELSEYFEKHREEFIV
ncbi:hypothetical protein FCU45_09510 [Sulfurimonas crateris]|uniref:Uncharacterized protein n=1 Tax=Sulfurimonas crateris TaxID=2574727 RepID=A0A4U2Z3H8_9BACT|nr:hypothetical protein [Sulfurimonas crateris]TKI68649.1 hypothetical protein FCU45_09510 [Sulfurimonas crateris]